MAIKYKLAVKAGTRMVDGQEKPNWKNVGVMLDGDRGPYILLDATFNPAGIERKPGSGSVLVSLFDADDEPRQGGRQRRQTSRAATSADYDDDIPF